MEKVTFLQNNNDGTEEAIEFFVLEQTRINNRNYLLVAESEEGDSDALILKDMADASDEDSQYEIVSEETELMAVAKVFEETMEDIKFETE
ncbi:MAG: DUF1292 domain-containing protein [Clostridia bacterium]|nr:DUF1292 domain-containing protein [Clostridia bacterium]